MTPEEYIKYYTEMVVPTLVCQPPPNKPPILDALWQPVSIKDYRSGLSQKAIKARSAIKKWLNAKAAIPDSGITDLGDSRWAITGIFFYPIYLLTDDDILATLNGKGRPRQVYNVLRVVSMMTDENPANKSLLGADDIVQFADWFCGLDCNGLITNYVRSVKEGATINHKLGVPDLQRGDRRSSLKDIKALDFVFIDGAVLHIAIISSIEHVTDKYVKVRLSEARSPEFGGAQTNDYYILKAISSDFDWRVSKHESGYAPRNSFNIFRHPDLAGVTV